MRTKQLITIIIMLVSVTNILAADKPIKAEMPIKSVTVYEDRALVTRSGEVDLPQGQSQVLVDGVAPGLFETSLRASVEKGNSRIISISSKTETKKEIVDEKIRAAEKEVKDLQEKMNDKRSRIAVIQYQQNYLEKFKRIILTGVSERITIGQVQFEDVEKAQNFIFKKNQDYKTETLNINHEINEIQKKLNDALNTYNALKNPQEKLVRSVEIDVDSKVAGKAMLSVSYIISNCGWIPRYDTTLKNNKVEVTYYGEIYQHTGESWDDVQLVLSTARPSRGATRPLVYPVQLSLRFVTKDANKNLGSTYDKDEIADAETGKNDIDDEAPMETEDDASSVVKNKGTSVVFELKEKSTIPADNRPHKVRITSFKDDAPKIYLECVPKLMKYVYLKCDTFNNSDYPVLPGRVDIFRDSGFIGTASVKFTAPGKPLKFSLGIDGDIKVKRMRLPHDHNSDTTSGSKRTIKFAYTIELENFKEEAITVLVKEHIPVSDIEEVEVELSKETTEFKSNKDGVITWEVKIAPNQKGKVQVLYTIEMPKSFNWSYQR